MIEHTYIIENILLYHILVKESLRVKRRKNFETLAYFIKYLHWNVLTHACYSNEEIAVPIYCTKFLAKNIDTLSEELK
jgi:hypothetical protein